MRFLLLIFGPLTIVSKRSGGLVFHYRNAFQNSLTFEEAKQACLENGATIATPEQFQAAHVDGYHKCDIGWLSDQSVRYSVQKAEKPCYRDTGNNSGVRTYGVQDATKTYDVYCFADKLSGEVFYKTTLQKFSYYEAEIQCLKLNARLATTSELHLARNKHMDFRGAGWLKDKSVRYPTNVGEPECGMGIPGVATVFMFPNQTGFPLLNSRYDAICYRDFNLSSELELRHQSEATAFTGLVFHYRPVLKRYTMTFPEAQQACNNIGGVIASPEHLQEAQKNGLHQCDYGWLSDQTVRFPITAAGPSTCQEAKTAGVYSLGKKPVSEHYDVFCFVERGEGKVFFIGDLNGFPYNEAEQHCQKLKSVLATPGQLSMAWIEGYNECRPGWLKDGSVRFPSSSPEGLCGNDRKKNNTIASSYEIAFPKQNSRYNAYCFKDYPSEVELVNDNETTAFKDLSTMSEPIKESEATAFWGVVFFYQNKNCCHSMTFPEAQQACKNVGAVIANPEQLKEANRNGLHQCSYGWLRNQTVGLPVTKDSLTSCLEAQEAEAKLQETESSTPSLGVYCFVEPSKGDLILATGNIGFTYKEAVKHCEKLNSTLATPGQLSAAWNQGFRECLPGWLKDQSIRISLSIAENLCASIRHKTKTSSLTYRAAFPDENLRFSAYCFRDLSPALPLITENEASAFTGVVFFYRPRLNRYTLSFPEAQKACENVGAVIASPAQLQEAHKNGLHQCDYGWLQDQTVRFPIVTSRLTSCPEAKQAGVQSLGTRKDTERYDVYCYVEAHTGELFLSNNTDGLTYEEAVKYCKKLKSTLASPGHLSAAWKRGFNDCSPGWLSDHSVRVPFTTAEGLCQHNQNPTTDGRSLAYQTAFPNKNSRHKAYCFEDQPSNLKLINGSEATAFSGVVFFHRPNTQQYAMTFTEAQQACLKAGGVIASPKQLQEAQKNGLHQCNYGWLRDKTVQLPYTTAGLASCPEAKKAGVQSLGIQTDAQRYDVYCFAKFGNGKLVLTADPDGFTFDEAVKYCETLNSTLASPAQLSAGWKKGFSKCKPGWLRDQSVRIPSTTAGGQCEGVHSASFAYQTGFPDHDSRYNAYCFRDLPKKLKVIKESEAAAFWGVVFFYQISTKQYAMHFPEAQQACKDVGAVIASPDQLKKANKNGLYQCSYGWLHNKTVGLPVTRESLTSCLETQEEEMQSQDTENETPSIGVYCFVEPSKGDLALTTDNVGFTYKEAVKQCEKLNSTLASPGQLSAAWSEGFSECHPGWLKDRSVRIPLSTAEDLCASIKNKAKIYSFSYQAAFPDESARYYAYCFKDLSSELLLINGSEASAFEGVVFFYRPRFYRYTMNFSDAKKACEDVGAAIASPVQLKEAHEHGLHQCDYGWLQDQTVRSPIATSRLTSCPEMREEEAGVQSLGRQKVTERYDVYCYAEPQDGELFLTNNTDGFTYEEAVKYCKKLKSTLATPGHLFDAWKRGFIASYPGWLTDRSVRVPFTTAEGLCRGNRSLTADVSCRSYQTGFPKEGSRYNAYCFKDDAEKRVTNGFNGSEAQSNAGLVFYYRPTNERYTMTFQEAKDACRRVKAEIATYEQLLAAQKNGLHQCDYGWIEDETVRLPIARGKTCPEILESEPGIKTLSFQEDFKHFDVYCYKQYLRCSNIAYCYHRLEGIVFLTNGYNNLTYKEAVRHCKERDSTLASPAQLSVAWQHGLKECYAGWLDDGSVRYLYPSPTFPCAGGKNNSMVYANSYYTLFAEEDTTFYAFCYKGMTPPPVTDEPPTSVSNDPPSEIEGYRKKKSSPSNIVLENEATASTGVVFHYKPGPENYTMTFEEAQQACQNAGAVIASLEQLEEAQRNGLHRCEYGWLRNQTVRHPTASLGKSCPIGTTVGQGVLSRGRTESTQRYDVYCFVEHARGKVFFAFHKDRFSYHEALQHCQKLNSTLATPGQLSAAWKQGFSECRPGWLKDRTVRSNIRSTTSHCQGSHVDSDIIYGSSYLTFFPNEDSRYNAYCIKQLED